MAMEQRMIAKMAQQLRMTPQLQQAIKLLQLSRMELIDLVAQEMVENPVLEEIPDNSMVSTGLEEELGMIEPQARPEPTETAEVGSQDQNVDWESFVEQFSSPAPTNSYRGMQGEDMPGLDQTLSTNESLVDHLLEQLRLLELDEEDSYIALLLIGNLDERGYMSGMTIEEISEETGREYDEVERILSLVQRFDPLGVAARDLRECLMIQLERLHPQEELALKLVEDHIPDLERKSYGKVARTLNVTKADVIDAAKLIATLEPKPGRGYVEDRAQYITPDIYIKKIGNEYVAMLNEDGLPKLRISNYYRSELQRKKEEGERDEVKEYIQDKLRGATWLIRSIHQRQRTIVKVTESIIKFQHDFFEKGVEHLKPLVLRKVAEDIEMHESTVSRVTSNKYVHTPRGIFELKYFFNSSISKSDGDDLASEAVKAKIRDIIADEDPKKPLSDAKIAKMLAEEDIDIARRTVAKYREMMGILSSAKRKQMF